MSEASLRKQDFNVKTVSPEAELIILCARTELDPRQKESIQALLAQNLDWQAILAALKLNRVMSLVYHSLRTFEFDADAQTQLKTAFQASIQRNLFLKAELLRILRAFEPRGMIARPFKGLVLAEMIYKNLALRETTDLDILVREADYFTAEQILLTLGYELVGSGDGKPLPPALKDGHNRRFWNKKNHVAVELHWDIAERYRGLFRMDEISADMVRVIEYEGVHIEVFTPEFHLILLCIHGYRHQWERLSWVCDVRELIQTTPDLDWDKLYQQAAQLEMINVLLMGLSLVDDLFGREIPDSLREKIRANSIFCRFGEGIEQRLLSKTEEEKPEKTDDYYRFNYAMLTSRRHKLNYLYYMTLKRIKWRPNERDKAWLPLPKPLEPLYYLLRPVRLISQYGMRYLSNLYHMLRS